MSQFACLGSVFPARLDELIRCLESRLGVPAPVGTALVVQILSSALGPAARLVDGSGPPMPAELNTVIAAPAGSTVPLARQALLAPLLALQEELWALAGEEPSSLLLPDALPDPADERARQCPVVLLAAPTFEELKGSLPRSFDGSVLAHFDAGSFERFWPELHADNNGSRLRILLQLLAGRSPVPRSGVPRREIVTVLVEVRPGTPACFEFFTRLSADLCSRFLMVEAGPASTAWPADPTLPASVLEAWTHLVQRVYARRGASSPQMVTVSPEASRVLNSFHAELAAKRTSWPAAVQDVVLGWPALARRVALALHQAEDDVEQPLQPIHARAAIELARYYGGQMLALRENAEREQTAARQLADRQRLLAKLKQLGEVDFRTLYRALPDPSPTRWTPVLDGLLAEGLVLELPDGKFSLAEHQLRRLCVV